MSNIFINAEYLDDVLIKKQMKHIKKYYELRQRVIDEYIFYMNLTNRERNYLNEELYDYEKYEKDDEFRELDEDEDFYEFRMLFKCKKYIEYLDNEHDKYMQNNKLYIIPTEGLNNNKMRIIGYMMDVDEIIIKY
jgi:hypothetical protein